MGDLCNGDSTDDDFAVACNASVAPVEVSSSAAGAPKKAAKKAFSITGAPKKTAKKAFSIPGDSRNRSPLEHAYVCAKAREGKAKEVVPRAKQAANAVVDKCMAVVATGRRSDLCIKPRGSLRVKLGKLSKAVAKSNRVLSSDEELQVAFHRSFRSLFYLGLL